MLKSKLIFLSLLATSSAIAQPCLWSQKITSKEEAAITDIRNVRTTLTPWKNGTQSCVATLEGKVSGQWTNGKGEFKWDGELRPSDACQGAVELAKKNLLSSLKSVTISSESTVVCKEQGPEEVPLINPPIGTVINNPNRLRKHPNFPNPFNYKGQECRWYLETGFNGKDIKQISGIVCMLEPTRWVIVDKF
jgi:hypothetical protein